ncbi:17-beta-hydroxysteroid dehydrogenase type 3 isoform X1 [Anguilla rostrata]|uniref:17-beta-hydroxysteroid dehydrogenase type 3 isoform X1 n=1 Tax=Anguilla rostrata TaxID=7938 RepID=UPI0030D51BFC
MDLGEVFLVSLGGAVLLFCTWKLLRVTQQLFPKTWYPVPKSFFSSLGEWAVITGGSEGIGRAYAFQLARHGLNIVIISRNLAKLETAAKEIGETTGKEVRVIVADFTKDDIYEHIEENLTGLNVGVLGKLPNTCILNNVGIIPSHTLCKLLDIEDLEQVRAVSTCTPVYLSTNIPVCLPAHLFTCPFTCPLYTCYYLFSYFLSIFCLYIYQTLRRRELYGTYCFSIYSDVLCHPEVYTLKKQSLSVSSTSSHSNVTQNEPWLYRTNTQPAGSANTDRSMHHRLIWKVSRNWTDKKALTTVSCHHCFQRITSVINCNVKGLMKMCRIVLPRMEKKGKGLILNMSSGVAGVPCPLYTMYGASKLFVERFSRSLQAEYKSKGIIIQAVIPFGVSTAMTNFHKPDMVTFTPEEFVKASLDYVLVGDCTHGSISHQILGWILQAIPIQILHSEVMQEKLSEFVNKSVNGN